MWAPKPWHLEVHIIACALILNPFPQHNLCRNQIHNRKHNRRQLSRISSMERRVSQWDPQCWGFDSEDTDLNSKWWIWEVIPSQDWGPQYQNMYTQNYGEFRSQRMQVRNIECNTGKRPRETMRRDCYTKRSSSQSSRGLAISILCVHGKPHCGPSIYPLHLPQNEPWLGSSLVFILKAEVEQETNFFSPNWANA